MSEHEIKNMTMPDKTHRTRARKYQFLLEMEVRDYDTLKGETAVFDDTPQNRAKVCGGVIPRYNKEFAPKRWAYGYADGKILVQRVT